jgi:UDP-GlcNAc:undecaprenyl-phosphate GlcNAc-1-phosphate transferase
VISVLAFLVATGVALALGIVVRRTAPRFGAVVPPRPDRWHRDPTPTMGGIAIAGATAGGFAAAASNANLSGDPIAWLAVLLAALAMFVVGVFDDKLQLSPVA